MRRRFEEEFEVDENNLDVDVTTDHPRYRKRSHGFPIYVSLVILLVLLGMFGLANWIDNHLPKPLTLADEASYPDSFISERAQHDLKLLTSLGSKVVGSHENEVLAVDFLKRELTFIINQKHKNQQIEIDQQVVTGAYFMSWNNIGRINKYGNVQNIVVKLYSHNSSALSILVNSHFDSVPTSPGASDDGISVVAMLEILRKMSRSPDRPLHNVIFLFNGAEETPLQASHGFITQHKWAKECKVLVNLEACGVGGRMILFQSGPKRPWLLKYYKKVPHPFGQVAGEELFQSGIIPSDTDFRIFRDFGNMIGLDMAFFKNGYKYHTKYDTFEAIPLGSYQHMGDNALSLVKDLANAPEMLNDNEEINEIIYFDIFGLFMITYTKTTAVIVNILVIILSMSIYVVSIIDFKLSHKQVLLLAPIALGSITVSWLLSWAFTLFLGYILDQLNYSMSWYSNPWIIFGLYVTPTIFFCSLVPFTVNFESLVVNVSSQHQAHMTRIMWTIVLLAGTLTGIRSVYALLIPVLFNSVAFAVIHLTRIQHSAIKWIMVYLSSLVIPTLILMYQISITMSLFVPITGRFGSNKNPDMAIGILATTFTITIISPYVAIASLLRDMKYYCAILVGVFLASLIVVFTAFGVPYNGESSNATPQRFWITHTARTFYNQDGTVNKTDSGIFFLNMDRNSPRSVQKYLKDYEKIRSVKDDCERYIICGVPLSHVRMMEIMEYSNWLPAVEPIIHEKISFTSFKEELNNTTMKYSVSITGPDRLGVYIVPYENNEIIEIKVNTPNVFDYEIKKDMYFIQQTYGKSTEELRIEFHVKTPENWNQPTVDLVVISHNVHDRLMIKTPYYEDFINQFPDWADVTAWLGTYSSYIL
ncbi:endoplasmic reticulum metallopeptidase 1-like isoform X2 [Aethina tumida]|uniref:endoplasmic reticulum metallopeptidase 1-like isoform X2 n=1 Tax=Aethina tumida TaxID=116153 RepID=UPI002148C1FE|nr:endoplasmic reticulum metallopeptidase 1-like isoform X2 [Aethina tumida]